MIIITNLRLSKLRKSSSMLTLNCKLYPLSSKSTINVLNVCKPFHSTSFNPNSVILFG
ncbi:hypothetical protein Hanom_Chr16g01457721 [Helianthus anomalus]